MRFANREAAGAALADRLEELGLDDPVVLALPRGGVPVAAQVARRLKAPLDVILVRKVGMPGQPELAAGAIVDGPAPARVWNEDLLRHRGLTEDDFADEIAEQLRLIERRRTSYLGDRAPVGVAGRDALVIDDGIATGATVRAALDALRRQGPRSVTLAVPVAPPEARDRFAPLVDRFIALSLPDPFWAVGQAYEDFGQTTDEEVVAALNG